MATQQTVAYKTYLKETLVEALRNVFVNHPDPTFRNTKVQLGYSLQRADLANTIVIRYYERFLRSAGVGHREWHNVSDDVNPAYQNLKHFLYKGDIEFEIVTLSARDRDWLSDALVTLIGMGETESYMQAFTNRVYYSNANLEPGSVAHFVNLQTEDFNGTGDTEGPAPWLAEENDVYVYRTGYRLPVFGEFYSRLIIGTSYSKVEKVEIYPWMQDFETEPNPLPSPADVPWVSLG
jgi:hypothetical protein